MTDQNISSNTDPVEDDDPPYFPKAYPDAPGHPDWDGVGGHGEQFPDAGEDTEDDTASGYVPDEEVM